MPEPAPIGITYVAASPLIGGGNRVVMDLMTGLDRRRFRPSLLAPASGPLTEWAASRGIPCRALPAAGESMLDTLKQVAAIARALRAFRTTIVHANSPSNYRTAGPAAWLTGAKRICHLHLTPVPGELAWCFKSSSPHALITCYRQQAEEVAGEMARLSPRTEIVPIQNCVDTGLFTPRPVDPASPFRFGARHVVLIMGHLSEVKGYSTFLRAAVSVRQRMEGVAFVALGGETIDCGARLRYEAMAADLGLTGAMHFLGWRPEVADIIRAADVVVLPSRLEGLPLTVLEAAACGKPVVATAVNGTPEAVFDNETGLLVKPDDPDGVAAAIVELLSDKARAQRMGTAARARMVEQFSLQRYLQSVETLYMSVAHAGATAAGFTGTYVRGSSAV